MLQISPSRADGRRGPPLHALDRQRLERVPEAGREVHPEAGDPADETLCCSHCNHPVTSGRERLVVAESHLHSRRNPVGIEYTFGCFASAPGCEPRGVDELEYTWFPGYSWRVVECGGCRTHLGWRFRAEAERFFALIVARLRSVDTPGLH